MTLVNQSRDYADLVQEDRAHSAIYTSEEIFEDELDRIFHRWWLYVGHASEIPEPGDYRLKWMGRQAVIMTRDKEGEIHLLLNRCRHRGTVVCHREAGNASFFRCAYHGWTYRNDGSLVGVPFPGAYGKDFPKESYGLTAVPRMEVYRGFVFASLSPTGAPFDEHLAPAKPYIDWFLNASPVGEIELRSGVTRTMYRGNWKFVGMDGYHPAFVHKSVQDVMRLTAPEKADDAFKLFAEDSPQRTVDMGQGHVRLDEQHTTKETILVGASKADGGANQRYRELMQEAYGDEEGLRAISRSDPHLGVWPNLQLIGSHVRVMRPLSAQLTEVEMFPALLKSVPSEINTARLRGHEWFYGPASFGSPDDAEIFERNQVGLMADVDPWVLLSRGLDREQDEADGSRTANITDEITQRGQLRQWVKVMSSEDRIVGEPVSVSRNA